MHINPFFFAFFFTFP
ncbi:pheA operon leader peptide PheL [Sodalis sp. RH21]